MIDEEHKQLFAYADEAYELLHDDFTPDKYDRIDDILNDLCDYMSSGPCICALCYKKTYSPIKDMKDIKHDFRDKYGKDEMRNGMHSSDTLKNVQREGKITLY